MTTTLGQITIGLVEDDPGARERLARVLSQSERTQLVFEAAMVREAFVAIERHVVDVLLVDLGLPDGSGLEVIRHCRKLRPATEVMVVSMFADGSNMLQAFEAGAHGYLLKDGSEEDIGRHVVNLHAGGSPMTPIIARQLLHRLTPRAAETRGPALRGLTPRESEILNLLARGYTYAEVARLLGLSASTVQTHVKSIYGKLEVHSRSEAVFEARQLGLL